MGTPLNDDLLATLELFRGLDAEQRAGIQALMRRRDISRGEPLVEAGEASDSLFIVLHGAFDVLGREDAMGEGPGGPIARLVAGDVVGEIGFFAGTPRTATVVATRDATVLELDRPRYEQAVAAAPSIVPTLLAVVARRLGETTLRLPPPPAPTEGRTVAIVPAGVEPLPLLFLARLRSALEAAGSEVLDAASAESRFGPDPDVAAVTRWLNDREWEDGLLALVAEPALTEWTRRCVLHADTVVLVTRGSAPAGGPTPVESFVAEVHGPATRRLVRVHDRRAGSVSGTPAWLARIGVFLHHHVSLEDDADFHSLVRFLTGRAVGYVAGGGGGFGPAHVGIHGAFRERGATFDAYIGTSVGAAVCAGFALLRDEEEMDENTHDIFVASRAFKRPTIPRYALLDHHALDDALARVAGPDTLIEDCWRPYFAVATNLSAQRLELIRTGPLWKAMRASSAIPGILPPFYTEDGTMLVDGGVMDNAPLQPMQRIKGGPNLVVHFGRTGDQRFHFRNEDFPGRWKLALALATPFGRRRLPRAPGAATVLMRSLMVHQRYDLPLGPGDLLLRPPRFPGSSFLNFDQHTRVFHAAREWAGRTIDTLGAEGDPRLARIFAAGAGAGDGAAVDSEPGDVLRSGVPPG